jgi:hypothetical protein
MDKGPSRLGERDAEVWLRADDYDFDLLARMFAVGDTRFVREGAPGAGSALPY